jgi:predicted ferric reductase
MAGVKYRGLTPRTQPLRWALFLLAVGGVIVATGPGVIAVGQDWLAAHQESLAWYGSRMIGFLAYGALTLSVVYGLLLSTGILDAVAHRAVSLTLHQELAAIGIGLTALHGSLLALDTYVPQTVRQLAIPFTGPYRPEWVGIGQVAFYLMLVIYASFYVRRHLGQRGWRLLHYTAVLAFAGATVHGLMSGTDTPASWALLSYVGASVAVAFLLGYRVVLGVAGPFRTAVPVIERIARSEPT